jgi:hypothetical protein
VETECVAAAADILDGTRIEINQRPGLAACRRMLSARRPSGHNGGGRTGQLAAACKMTAASHLTPSCLS